VRVVDENPNLIFPCICFVCRAWIDLIYSTEPPISRPDLIREKTTGLQTSHDGVYMLFVRHTHEKYCEIRDTFEQQHQWVCEEVECPGSKQLPTDSDFSTAMAVEAESVDWIAEFRGPKCLI
jgi:hypothetical protein